MTEAKKKDVATVQQGREVSGPTESETSGSVALMRLIEKASVSPDFDVAKLDHLLSVKERWEANEARKAYVEALNEFKVAPPKVTKNKHVAFRTAKGDTEYDHATLDQVVNAIAPALSKCGLSHSWRTSQSENGVSVTCTLTHVLGHSESVTLSAPADQSGGKNTIQAIGSTVTYLQRYTLLAITGLAVEGMDTDGEVNETISAEQRDRLKALIDETGADIERFCFWLNAGALSEIRASDYQRAEQKLLQKKAKAEQNGGAS